MARSRVIKPEFWSDEKLARVSREARLTFVGLWNVSDDYGVTKGNTSWIKSQLFPYDEDLKQTTLTKWLSELEQAGFIVQFQSHDENFYYIRNFSKHQKVDHPSKQRNAEPPLDIDSRKPRETLTEPSRQFRVETETETEYKLKQNKDTEGHTPKPKKKRQTIPIDFCLTDQLIEFAKSQGINGNIQTIFDQFKDHHTNKGTLGLDWPAAWRTWVRNEIKFNSGKSTQSFTDKVKSERDVWMRERGLTQS